MWQASKFAEEHLKEEQKKMKQAYDKHATPIPIEAGDAVYVYQPKIRVRKTKKKLQKNYHGPYIVVEFNTPTTVILKRLSDGKTLDKSVNIMRLKKGYIRQKQCNWDPLPVSEDGELSEDESSFGDDAPAESGRDDNGSDDSLPTLRPITGRKRALVPTHSLPGTVQPSHKDAQSLHPHIFKSSPPCCKST